MTSEELFESRIERRLQIPEWKETVLRLDGYTLWDSAYATVCGKYFLENRTHCDNETVVLVSSDEGKEYSLACRVHAEYIASLGGWEIYEI